MYGVPRTPSPLISWLPSHTIFETANANQEQPILLNGSDYCTLTMLTLRPRHEQEVSQHLQVQSHAGTRGAVVHVLS